MVGNRSAAYTPPRLVDAKPQHFLLEIPAVAAAPAGSASYGMSLAQAWGYGGLIMWVLLAISILMVALVIYFLCVFRAGAVAPRRLQSEVRNYLVAVR